MKTLFNICSFLFLASLVLPACKKDEVKTVLKSGTAPTLTGGPSAVVLDTAKKTQTAVTFNWNAANFGYSAATTYTLQIAKKGKNFSADSTVEIGLGSATTASYTVADFNRNLLKVIPAGLSNDVEVRIKADLGTSAVAPVFSNAITLNAKPYRDIILYPSLYVPGDYQAAPNWTPATAAKVSSVKNDKMYEGYVNFTSATTNFKLTSDPDWNHTNYGDGGAGKLNSAGNAGNLSVSPAGYYLLKANLNDLSWSATKVSWGIIGDATPSGWGADTDMTYNAASGKWTITTNLTAGELKFRANDAWTIDFGDNEGDGAPEYGGKNIKVTAAGNYTITLDLSIPGNYSYDLKKN